MHSLTLSLYVHVYVFWGHAVKLSE